VCVCVCVLTFRNSSDQAPPDNLVKDGFPTAVCNQGEGGGELYNRAAGVKWSKSSGDKYLSKAGSWAHPEVGVARLVQWSLVKCVGRGSSRAMVTCAMCGAWLVSCNGHL
jgi:hypothetical protein